VSPVRRLLLAGLVVVALLAAAVVVAVRLSGAGAAGAAGAAGRTGPVDQARPGPVLLVPGYGGSTAALDVLAGRLREAGREAQVVRLPGDGTGDLAQAARVLGKAVERRLDGGAASVDVVGFSAGGVVVRLWARDEGGAAQARRIVTLGAPHHGTQVAQYAATYASGQCPDACRQLVPGSPLLRRLADGDETPDGPQWLSLWTTQDRTVTPPESARLEGAVDLAVQDVCPAEQVAHSDLPRNVLVAGIVLRALGPQPLTAPVPADCEALRRAGS
jgi:triacylglycerol lipase